MFGKLFTSLKRGIVDGAQAVTIIQQISGIKADEMMIAGLRRRAEINQQGLNSMNGHEYAFEAMFKYYVDLDDSYPVLRKKWITKEHPLRKKIIDAFDDFVARGIISDSYIIGLYESAKCDRATDVIHQDKKIASQNGILKSIPSGTSEISSSVGHAEPPKTVTGSTSSNINHRRFLVNEKVVPKGVPTFSGQPKSAPQEAREEGKQATTPVSLDKKEEKKQPIKYRCPTCRVEMSKSKLLKSEIGADWKKCPFCNANFQT